MFKSVLSLVVGSILGALLLASPAEATCPGTAPTNGTTADALQLTNWLACNYASLTSPNFQTSLAINSSTTSHLLDINNSETFTSSVNVMALMAGTFSSSSTSSLYTLDLATTFSPTGGSTTVSSILAKPQVATGSLSNMRGVTIQPTLLSGYSGTITNASGVEVLDISPANETNITNYAAFKADAFTNGNGITTGTVSNYGVLVLSSTASAASGGTVNNFGASLAVGTGSGAGTTNNYGLRITGNGGTGGGGTTVNYGIDQTSTAQDYFAATTTEFAGTLKVDTFASASATAVCQNGNVLSSCSSSLRYKEDVKDAPFGLSEVEQMRPVTFKWKGRDENDLGLIAEEVAKINPLFATYKDGKVEGVKYAQLTAVLVGAIKELRAQNGRLEAASEKMQAQSEHLQSIIADQQTRISALERANATRASFNDRSGRLRLGAVNISATSP